MKCRTVQKGTIQIHLHDDLLILCIRIHLDMILIHRMLPKMVLIHKINSFLQHSERVELIATSKGKIFPIALGGHMIAFKIHCCGI